MRSSVPATLRFNGGALQTTAAFASAKNVTSDRRRHDRHQWLRRQPERCNQRRGRTGERRRRRLDSEPARIRTPAALPSSAGTLQGNSTSLQGSIVNNAAVVFDQAVNGTYAGVMSGTGSLTKNNGGTLILTGANTLCRRHDRERWHAARRLRRACRETSRTTPPSFSIKQAPAHTPA